jgi:hypothetical protein
MAARKIQKFLREKMVHFFGWKRSFRKVDSENLRKIRHQALLPTPASSLIISKLRDHTPMSIQHLSRTNTASSLATPKTPNRPDSAPDLHKLQSGLSKRSSHSLKNLLEADTSRPGTAPGGSGHTFLTEDPRDSAATPITGGGSTRKDVLSLCRQRRSSSVSAMLTARKMLFSDHSAPIISNVFEEEEDDDGSRSGAGEGAHLPEAVSEGEEVDPTTPVLVAPNERFLNGKKQRKRDRRKKRFEQMMFGCAPSPPPPLPLPQHFSSSAQAREDQRAGTRSPQRRLPGLSQSRERLDDPLLP